MPKSPLALRQAEYYRKHRFKMNEQERMRYKEKIKHGYYLYEEKAELSERAREYWDLLFGDE